MPDYRTMFDLEFIAGFELGQREATFTIESVSGQKIKGAEGKENKRPVVVFTEKRRDGQPIKLVVNKTNGRTIADLYGNDTKNWVGRRVTLFAMQVKAFGKTDLAVRVRPTRPADNAPTVQREPGDDA